MPTFSRASLAHLAECDPRLQRLAHEMIRYFDFSVIEGHRPKAEQDAAYARGASQVKWPKSQHNKTPARAFDAAPFPIDWNSKATAIARFGLMGGVALVCARQLGIKIRFGWDWNRNADPRDESFLDWPHIELDEA